MPQQLKGQKVAFLVANEGIEQVELTDPWHAVIETGGVPELIAPDLGTAQGMNHLDKADIFDVDRTTKDADPAHYAAVVYPGGVANPDQLRLDRGALEFTRAAFESGKPVAAICHGPWTLVEADVVSSRTLTSWPSLRTDITNAGGTWIDEEVVVCTRGPNTLITSRKPGDLKAFCEQLIETVAAVR